MTTMRNIEREIAALALLAAFAARAAVFCTQDGATLSVRATSGEAGKGLVLLWDDADRGADATSWANSTNILVAVAAAGSSVTVDLASLGIANGAVCRIATAYIYERLDMLQMTTTGCWIDTGFKGTEVYGVRFGYYTTGLNKKSGDWCAAIGCGKDNNSSYLDARGGFLVASNNNDDDLGKTVWMYRGYYNGNNKPSAKTDSINEYAFTNGVFTLNGTRIANNLNNQAKPNYPNAVSTNETYNINIGRSPNAATGMAFGWWSHVSFDDADGNRILDYVPVRRGDGKVGFWDYATSSFVTSGGSGNFTAGAATGESLTADLAVATEAIVPNRALAVAIDAGTLAVTVPAGLAGERIIVAWDSTDRGGDLADWGNSAVIAESAAAGEVTARLGRLGVRNGDAVRVFAATAYIPLETLLMANRSSYVDTYVKGKNVHGVKMGFYPTTRGTGGMQDANFALNCGKGGDTSWTEGKGGFHIGLGQCNEEENSAHIWNARLEGPVLWGYHGYSSTSAERPNWKTDSLNDIAFTNRVFTLNGTTIKSGLRDGAICTNDLTVTMGRNNPYGNDNFFSLCGHWGWLRLDDSDGNAIIDFVPVKRVGDNLVCFYDRATKSCVAPSAGGNNKFTAGAVASETEVVDCNAVSAALRARKIPGLTVIFR